MYLFMQVTEKHPSICIDNELFFTGLSRALEEAQVTINGYPIQHYNHLLIRVRELLSKPKSVRPSQINVVVFPRDRTLGQCDIDLKVIDSPNGEIVLSLVSVGNVALAFSYFGEYMEAVLP